MGSYWTNQALEDIIHLWTEHSQDKKYGAFHTNLDSAWIPSGSQDKYPSMISRHLFSYSAAYLLSDNLERADVRKDDGFWPATASRSDPWAYHWFEKMLKTAM